MLGSSPAKAFASVLTSGKKIAQQSAYQDSNLYHTQHTQQNMSAPQFLNRDISKSDRHIQVTAVGEVSLPPDRCRVTVKIRSQKDNVQDVKNGIQRRLDYVMQTFQNHNVKETDLQVHKSLRRAESMYDMDAEVTVVFLDFHKCQSACNYLVEKLDETVAVGMQEFYHAGTTLETLRQQASLLAVHNAKEKAKEMAAFVHQAVGKPITIQEEESKEWEGQAEGVADIETRPTVQQRMAQATVTVACRVNATFELKPKVRSKNAN